MKRHLWWIALISARLAIAAAPDPSVADVNARLAEAARTDPHWRADIRAETGSPPPQPGRSLARSPLLGLISYRPKTFAELSPEERIRWTRSELSRHPAPHRVVRFAIPPDEMRRSRPFVYSVPPAP